MPHISPHVSQPCEARRELCRDQPVGRAVTPPGTGATLHSHTRGAGAAHRGRRSPPLITLMRLQGPAQEGAAMGALPVGLGSSRLRLPPP